jgi:hypothetical protein
LWVVKGKIFGLDGFGIRDRDQVGIWKVIWISNIASIRLNDSLQNLQFYLIFLKKILGNLAKKRSWNICTFSDKQMIRLSKSINHKMIGFYLLNWCKYWRYYICLSTWPHKFYLLISNKLNSFFSWKLLGKFKNFLYLYFKMMI